MKRITKIKIPKLEGVEHEITIKSKGKYTGYLFGDDRTQSGNFIRNHKRAIEMIMIKLAKEGFGYIQEFKIK